MLCTVFAADCDRTRDLLRSTRAAGCFVSTFRILAVEAKCQTVDRCRERTERDLETPGACHHASNRHEGGGLFGRVVNPVRQPAGAIRPDGHPIPMTDLRDRTRERPHDRMRDDEVVEGLRRLESKGLIGSAEMRPKQFVECRVVP